METIWKYQFKIEDEFEIEMPSMSEILSVQMQGVIPCIWAKVWGNGHPVKRKFQLFGTGQEIPRTIYRRKYIATFQYSPVLVFHLFELNNH